jgi:hypothetical protein
VKDALAKLLLDGWKIELGRVEPTTVHPPMFYCDIYHADTTWGCDAGHTDPLEALREAVELFTKLRDDP